MKCKHIEIVCTRIKDKINHPPEKRDFQKVSHSLARFIKLKDAAKKQSSQPSKKKKLKRITNDNEDKPGKKYSVCAKYAHLYALILTNS